MVGKMLDLNPKFCRTFTIFRNNMTILENLYHYTTKWLDSDIRFTIYYIFYILFPYLEIKYCSIYLVSPTYGELHEYVVLKPISWSSITVHLKSKITLVSLKLSFKSLNLVQKNFNLFSQLCTKYEINSCIFQKKILPLH